MVQQRHMSHLEQVKREDAIESPSSPTQDKTKDDVTAEKVEDVKRENLLNGPAEAQSHLEEVKREDAIESPSPLTQGQPPLATLFTSRDNDVFVLSSIFARYLTLSHSYAREELVDEGSSFFPLRFRGEMLVTAGSK